MRSRVAVSAHEIFYVLAFSYMRHSATHGVCLGRFNDLLVLQWRVPCVPFPFSAAFVALCSVVLCFVSFAPGAIVVRSRETVLGMLSSAVFTVVINSPNRYCLDGQGFAVRLSHPALCGGCRHWRSVKVQVLSKPNLF